MTDKERRIILKRQEKVRIKREKKMVDLPGYDETLKQNGNAVRANFVTQNKTRELNEQKIGDSAMRLKKQREKVKNSNKILLGIAFVFVIFTGVFAFLTAYFADQKNLMERHLNSVYEKNFSDSVDSLNNLSVSLSKLRISQGEDCEKYLLETQKSGDAAAYNLSSIPVMQDEIVDSVRFVNQVSDFCGYLKQKISRGGKYSEGDREIVESLCKTNMQLVEKLNSFYTQIANGYRFTANLNINNIQNSPLSNGFRTMQSGAIEYPRLIYDGPFSQSKLQAEWKGLPADEISKEEAQNSLQEFFIGKNIVFAGEIKAAITVYNFKIEFEGKTAFAQVSKKGGKLILYENYRELNNVQLTVNECTEKAQEFVNEQISDMIPVWSSESGGVLYINFVFRKGGIIYYNDMVMLKIARDNGEILGYEATSFYKMHTQRELPDIKKTVIQSRQSVFSKLKIENERLALIPLYENEEALAYEFFGVYDGILYFVYIDAVTGKEINVLRVVDTAEGSMVV